MPNVITSPKTERPIQGDQLSAEAKAAAAKAAEAARIRKPAPEPALQVRAADLEPYIGLKYLSRLFKLMAVVLILLLISEVIVGFVTSGVSALTTLLDEVSRLVVFSGLLWGSGDLAILLVDIGHDMRATRILLGRQLAHHTEEHHAAVDPVMASAPGGQAPVPMGDPIPPV
jgi:hypothetical protein